ncbi:MAG TPA: rhodanese-like domain-containing protein [Actinomycetota bacterium]|jgi:rhodanese-related sulfurtransferase|nr:rhodanese-like domain-containing protein [Actinomycetota bacterium]
MRYPPVVKGGAVGNKRAMDLVAEAKEQIENLTPAEVAAELEKNGVVLVDLRERDELEAQGAIPGAIHAPRGMLEFYADASTPYHRKEFDPAARTILYCASGGRSALGCNSLKEMGFRNIAHLDGGFKSWIAAGNPVQVAQ